MKKYIIILLISLGVIGGIIFYKVVLNEPKVDAAAFLPKDTLFYLNQKNLGSIIQDFRDTPIANAITSIDYIKLSLDIELPIQNVEFLRKAQEFLALPGTEILFDEIFSHNFSLALIPQSSTENSIDYVRKNFLFIAQPQRKFRLHKKLLSAIEDQYIVTSSQYGKYMIHRTEVNTNLTLSFVHVGPVLLLSMDDRTIRQVLDNFDLAKSNLKDNFFFTSLQKYFNESNLFCYFSLKDIHDKLNQSSEINKNRNSGLLRQFEKWKGFLSGGYGLWNGASLKRDGVRLYFNKNSLDENNSELLSLEPEKDTRINQVPADVSLYYSTNSFDLQNIWDVYSNDLKKRNADLEGIKRIIHQLSGLHVEELLELVGRKCTIFVKEPNPVDFLPLPNFALVFDSKNIKKTAFTVRKILSKNKVPHKSFQYRGVTLTYWGEEVQLGLQPVVAFYKNSVYMASSISILKEIVDVIITGSSLARDATFLKTSESLLLKNNTIGFVQLEPMVDIAKELVSLSGTMVAIENRRAARTTKILIDTLINPLLESLKMYSTFSTRTYVEEGIITIETTTVRTAQ